MCGTERLRGGGMVEPPQKRDALFEGHSGFGHVGSGIETEITIAGKGRNRGRVGGGQIGGGMFDARLEKLGSPVRIMGKGRRREGGGGREKRGKGQSGKHGLCPLLAMDAFLRDGVKSPEGAA